MRAGTLFLASLAAASGWLPGSAAAVPETPVHSTKTVDEDVLVERGLAIVRLDPKPGARPHECDGLVKDEIEVRLGGRPARVTSVERVQRPERHWLVIDISESAEGRRAEAKRSAIQYVREVMTPGIDTAALVTVDEDTVLVTVPSTDPERVVRAIENTPPGGASALRDGLETVLRQIEGDRHEHLVLFWSDGLDNESVSREDDLFRTIARVPQATIFPLALLPPGSSETQPAMLRRKSSGGSPILGELLFEAATRTGGEVFASSDPKWLDRVRGWIGRRFEVAFAPDLDSPGPETMKRRLSFATPRKSCSVTMLFDPFARPDAVAGEAAPAPESWVREHARAGAAKDDAPCEGPANDPRWDGPLEGATDGVEGCVLDLVEVRGPVVRRRRPLAFDHATARFAARRIRIEAPALDRLPRLPVDVLERIVPSEEDDPASPALSQMEGASFLTQRARIAASLFALRPDYREFALARLARFGEEDLRAIEREFARTFPDLPRDQIAAIARASRAGRRVIDAGRTPTDADLARCLAVWLGDVRARDLFAQWELGLCDARIARGPDGSAFARWTRLRARLGYPFPVRVVAPLALLHDPRQDVLGFVRIVLPRPEGPVGRADTPKLDPAADDRVAEAPLGLWLVDRIAASSPAVSRLASRGYTTTSVATEHLPATVAAGSKRPVPVDRVVVVLSTAVAPAATATLDASIAAAEDGTPSIVRFAARVEGDPDLAALLEPLRR